MEGPGLCMRLRAYTATEQQGQCMTSVRHIAALIAATLIITVAGAQVLDEVVVSGKRLRALRAEVIKTEDRVVARYNELNQDDDLDIECHSFTPTGSRLSHRYCLLKLQKRAQEKDAIEYMTYMVGAAPEGFAMPGGAPNTQVTARLMERSEDYRKNLVRLLTEHPELRELVVESGEARRRYDAAIRTVPEEKPLNAR